MTDAKQVNSPEQEIDTKKPDEEVKKSPDRAENEDREKGKKDASPPSPMNTTPRKDKEKEEVQDEEGAKNISGEEKSMHLPQEFNRSSYGAPRKWSGGGQRSNDIEFETAVMIPSESCGIVIGQGGRNIKRIREVTGVVAFLEQEDPERTEKKPLYLHGSIQGVQTAMAMVNDLLNGRGIYRSVYQPIVGRPVPLFASSTPYYFPSGGAANGMAGNLASSSKFDQARMSGRGVEVEVPGFAVGFIIGKRGDQIRALCEQTGTNIQFNRNDTLRGSEVHHAYIEGTPDQVEKCIERMNEMVTRLYHELCTGQRLGSGAATTGDFPGNPISQPSQFYQSAGFPSQPSSFAQSSSGNQWAAMPLAQSGYYGSTTAGIQQQQPQFSTQTGTVDYTQAWVHYYEALGDYQQANALREGLRQQQAQSAMAMSFPTLGSGSGGGAGGLLSSAFPNLRS